MLMQPSIRIFKFQKKVIDSPITYRVRAAGLYCENTTTRPTVSTIALTTKNLVKASIQTTLSWSSGMVSSALFATNILESQKYLNVLNARKE